MLNRAPVPKAQRLTSKQRERLLQVFEDLKTLLEMIGPQWDGKSYGSDLESVSMRECEASEVPLFHDFLSNADKQRATSGWQTLGNW